VLNAKTPPSPTVTLCVKWLDPSLPPILTHIFWMAPQGFELQYKLESLIKMTEFKAQRRFSDTFFNSPLDCLISFKRRLVSWVRHNWIRKKNYLREKGKKNKIFPWSWSRCESNVNKPSTMGLMLMLLRCSCCCNGNFIKIYQAKKRHSLKVNFFRCREPVKVLQIRTKWSEVCYYGYALPIQ